MYQQFIMGMLNNFDSLPLDRIHNMLKMFMSDDQCTQPHSHGWWYSSFLCL